MQADVQLRDYVIPKRTTVMTNVWTIQRDPDFYEESDLFVPERYIRHPLGIKKSAPDQNRKALYTFGFGRRERLGKEFYFQHMELTLAQVIWAFDIEPTGALDLDIQTGFVFGVASRPKPLQVKFVPRRSHEVLTAEHKNANIALGEILGV
jgi:cytochrome P450